MQLKPRVFSSCTWDWLRYSFGPQNLFRFLYLKRYVKLLIRYLFIFEVYYFCSKDSHLMMNYLTKKINTLNNGICISDYNKPTKTFFTLQSILTYALSICINKENMKEIVPSIDNFYSIFTPINTIGESNWRIKSCNYYFRMRL